MTPENLLTEWARLLVESLADAGLRDVVVSPGSRSTPLAFAILSSHRLRAISVVDERSAAFHALGMAKVAGTPTAVVCTSGSAAANYFPAIVEAASSRTPLLVITADRPFELQDCSASQTLDQIKIFGSYVRRFADLGMPDPSPAALGGLRRRAIQGFYETMLEEPGPVHLDFRARKPLEPTVVTSEAGSNLTRHVDALLATAPVRVTRPRRVATDESIAALATACMNAKQGVIVVGPAPYGLAPLGMQVAKLAGVLGFPVFAEATSQLRFDGTDELGPSLTLDALDGLLGSAAFRDSFRPDVVLHLGEPLTSGTWDRFVATAAPLSRHVIAAHGWPDPHGTAASLTIGEVEDTVQRLVALLVERRSTPPSSPWVEWLARANAVAWNVVNDAVSSAPGLTEAGAVRAVLGALAPGGLLVVGNSLPVRHVDAFCAAAPAAGVGVCSQRGVSGIDGVVSSAAGSSRASERATVLVVGDVSALHDLGGFAVASTATTPFVVVVLNNDGGRIFEQLPLAKAGLGEDHLRFWTTPHGVQFDGLARLFPLKYERPTTPVELGAALQRGLSHAGCTVVEVPVAPHGAQELYARIAARLDESLRAVTLRAP